LYSYDWLENLAGCQMHSADRVVPEWQSVEVGDHILHICQVDKFLGDEDKKGLYAWNGFGKVAPAAEG